MRRSIIRLGDDEDEETTLFVPRVGSLVAVNQRVGGWQGGLVYSPGEIGLVLSVDTKSEVAGLLIGGARQDFYLGYIGPVEGAR